MVIVIIIVILIVLVIVIVVIVIVIPPLERTMAKEHFPFGGSSCACFRSVLVNPEHINRKLTLI